MAEFVRVATPSDIPAGQGRMFEVVGRQVAVFNVDGHFRKIEAQYRKFNYMGDVTWIKGKVLEKTRENGRKIVRCEVWCENHRDERTAKALIEVELP